MNKLKFDIALHVIDRLLAQKGMNRVELAEKLGVDRSTVTKWFMGEVDIPEHRMIPIAQILGVDSRVIFPDARILEKLSKRET